MKGRIGFSISWGLQMKAGCLPGRCALAKEKLRGSKQKWAGQHLLASDRWDVPNLMCFQLPVPWISEKKIHDEFHPGSLNQISEIFA